MACILKINENATLIYSISFEHGLANQNFVFIRQLILYIYCQKIYLCIDRLSVYALFKSTCSETSYMTHVNVPHE